MERAFFYVRTAALSRTGTRRCISAVSTCSCDVVMTERSRVFSAKARDAFRYSVCGASRGFKNSAAFREAPLHFGGAMARTLAEKLCQISSDSFRYARSAVLPSHTCPLRPANSSAKRRPPFRKPPRFLLAFGGRVPSGRACAAIIPYRSIRSIFAPSAFSSFSRDS